MQVNDEGKVSVTFSNIIRQDIKGLSIKLSLEDSKKMSITSMEIKGCQPTEGKLLYLYPSFIRNDICTHIKHFLIGHFSNSYTY